MCRHLTDLVWHKYVEVIKKFDDPQVQMRCDHVYCGSRIDLCMTICIACDSDFCQLHCIQHLSNHKDDELHIRVPFCVFKSGRNLYCRTCTYLFPRYDSIAQTNKRKTDKPWDILEESSELEKNSTGLFNLGNTCFLNAVLQVLHHFGFAEFIDPHSCFFASVLHTFLVKMNSATTPLTAEKVYSALGMADGLQHDAHETLVIIFSRLCSCDLNAPTMKCPASSLFGFKMCRSFQCADCDYEYNTVCRHELQLELNHLTDKDSDIYDLMHKNLVNVEAECPECKGTGRENSGIKDAPQVLIIHLARVTYTNALFAQKSDAAITIPEKLNLSEYIHESDKQLEDVVLPSTSSATDEEIRSKLTLHCMYQLKEVLCHSGEADAGHYYVIKYDSEGNSWTLFNDEVVEQFDINTFESRDMYMLFYQKCSEG